MKVILLEDVAKVGKKDEVVEVSPGFGKNFLVKNKQAILYTKGSVTRLEKEVNLREEEYQNAKKLASELKEVLEKTKFEIKVKTGVHDKVFGSISSKQITELLKAKNFSIDKKKIHIDHSIASLGAHEVIIDLHKEVQAKVVINVVKL